jgi:type I restriction enzyme, S subunit
MSDELPEGWADTVLGKLVSNIQTGFACGKHSRDGAGVAHLRPMNVSEEGRVVLHDVKYVAASEMDRDERRLTQGDVLFNNTNSPELVGKTGVYVFAEQRAFSNHMTRVRCAPGVLDPSFCALALHHRWQTGYFQAKCNNHVSQASVGRDLLLATEMRLAPVAEQQRIVARVEELFAEVERTKSRLNKVRLILMRLRQSLLASACSGELTQEWREDHPDVQQGFEPPPSAKPARRGRRGANLSHGDALLVDDEMSDLPATWTYARADHLVEPETVVTYGIVLPGPEIDGGVPYVRGQDVEDGRLRTDALRHTTAAIAAKHARSALRQGDVLLCIIRNLRVAIVPEGIDGANITQGMVRFRPDTSVVHREYLAAYLASPQAQEWMKRRYFGMDMPRINVEDARAVPVALPPLQEQLQIVQLLQEAQRAVAQIERAVGAALQAIEALPQAILSKAFSGELVPTEAELARSEHREYESASMLLERGKSDAVAAPTKAKRRAPKRRQKVSA